MFLFFLDFVVLFRDVDELFLGCSVFPWVCVSAESSVSIGVSSCVVVVFAVVGLGCLRVCFFLFLRFRFCAFVNGSVSLLSVGRWAAAGGVKHQLEGNQQPLF